MPDEAKPEPAAGPTPLLKPLTSLPGLCPNDHLRLLTELLKPEVTPLVRRWVAALMLADEAQRLSIVEAVEARIVRAFVESPDVPIHRPGHASDPEVLAEVKPKDTMAPSAPGSGSRAAEVPRQKAKRRIGA